MVAAGDDPAALTPVMRTQLAASVAAAADVPVSGVTLRVVAASLLLIFDVAVDTAAASKGLAASLAARMATPEAATMLVSVAGVTVIATPATRALVETVLAPSPSPPSPSPPPPLLPSPMPATPSRGSGSPSPPALSPLGEASISSSTGSIAGGAAAGGLVLCLIIGLAIWLVIRRARAKGDARRSTVVVEFHSEHAKGGSKPGHTYSQDI